MKSNCSLIKPSEKLFNITYQKASPLLCTFELTQRCVLRCRHCYINFIDPEKAEKKELKTGQVKKVLDDLAKSGVLYLVFTGGEVFLRRDFLELCGYARKKGFDLRIFSSAMLLTEEKAKKLSLMNISSFEVSIYGRKEVHERITGLKGSFNKLVSSVNLLKRYKVPVTLKSVLMKNNFREYKWLMNFAEENGVAIRMDPTLVPKNNGEKNILSQRLTKRQMQELYSSPAFQVTGVKSAQNTEGNDLMCSAGINLLAIGYEGTVYPCLELPVPLGNVKKRRLAFIWRRNNRALTRYRNVQKSDLEICSTCSLSKICQRCPGLAYLEDGDILGPSKIACKTAEILKSIVNR